jgi:Na+-transporting methylmalonyl-CoA/oxaloacetate decarboxylase gamma subunit
MNIIKKSSAIIAVILLGTFTMEAQNVTDLIISEAFVNDGDSTGLVDNYGERNGWIEVLNTSQGTVKFGGIFLSDDRSDLMKYLISKSDISTKLGPRQVVVFYCNGVSERGTYSTNFTIHRGSTVYLTSNDGRTVVDSIKVPADLPEGMSVSKLADDNKQMVFNDIQITRPTPGIQNGNLNEESGSQKMKRMDPHGWILTLVSVSVVFIALLILWLIFNTTGKFFQGQFKNHDKGKVKDFKKRNDGTQTDNEIATAIAMALDKEMNSEVYAAIAMALDEYLGDTAHDTESFVITIKSHPTLWTSKEQIFRKSPR